MTSINLLPSQPKRIIEEKKWAWILLIAAVVLLIVATLVWATLNSLILVNNRQTAEAKKAIDALIQNITSQNQTEQRQALLINRLDGINALLTKRISFYDRVNNL